MECNIKFIFTNINLKNCALPSHSHNCYELVYYLKGRGRTEFNNLSKLYKSNSFSIICPGVEHSECSDSETTTILIGFTVDNTDMVFDSNLYFDENKRIFKLIENIRQEYEQKNLNFELKGKLLIGEILIEINRMANKVYSDNSIEFLNIVSYIDENITESIDLKELASEYCISYDRFRHVFKDVIGVSPNKYITIGRLKYSINLLQSTNLSITDIALKSGFGDSSKYSAIFKRVFGLTPKSYRNTFDENK